MGRLSQYPSRPRLTYLVVLEESKVERRGSPTSSTRRTKRKAPRQADSSDDEKNVDADGVSEAPKRHRLSSSSLDTTVSGVERVGGGAKGEKENERKARKRKEKKRQQKKRKHDERRTDNSEPDSGIEPSKPGRGELLKGGKKLKTSGKER